MNDHERAVIDAAIAWFIASFALNVAEVMDAAEYAYPEATDELLAALNESRETRRTLETTTNALIQQRRAA